MGRAWLGGVAAALALGATASGAQIIAPSEMENRIERPGVGGGTMEEVDAAAAQVSSGGSLALPAGTRQRIEEIVVRARKRDELLEDTPVSVTALGAATLREAGVQRLDEIRELVPNLTFTSRRNVEADVRIRGIGSTSGELAFDPGSGIFVDGVFLSRSFGGLIDVLDVEQIEVLRGPQGTLFGKNTVGGAVNISTVRPREDFEGFILLRPGNLESLSTRAMINLPIDKGPLADRVFLRLSMASTNDRGYTYNRLRREYSSNQQSLTLLGSVRALLRKDLTLDVSGSWSRFHNNGKGGECRVARSTALQDLAVGFADACAEGEPFRFASNVDNLVDVTSFGTWGTLTWDIGTLGPIEEFNIKYIGSWRKQLPRRRHDFDMTQLPVLVVSNVGGSPIDGVEGYQQQISQEIQMGGRAWERLSFVVGAFGFWEEAELRSGTVVRAGPVVSIQDDTDRIDNTNWALFGQATLDLTQWAALTAGLRFTDETKGITVINRFGANVDNDRPDEQKGSQRARFDAWTPMASLALRAPDPILEVMGLDHLLGYFTYARGFKGGGFNAVLAATSVEPFGPEHLDSYELGLKTILFEQRLQANLSVFTANYDDIQVATLINTGDPDGDGIPNLERVILNAAEATNRGVEVEVMARPIEGLQITGSLGFLAAKYRKFEGISALTGEPIDRQGQRLTDVPRFQSYLSIQYSLPLAASGPRWLHGWLTPRLDWAYTSSTLYAGPELPEATQAGFNLLHARLSYDFLDDRAQVALWGKNLTNAVHFSHVNPLASSFGTLVRYYDPPRLFGAELSYRF